MGNDHESPFSIYLRNLSPIKSVKASKYAQRFSQTNYHVPPPPVFTSPRMDMQREPTFIKREETDAAGSDGYRQGDVHLNHEFIYCFRKEDQSDSPAGCIDDYLTDPVDTEATTNGSRLPHNNKPLHEYTIKKADDHPNSNLFLHPFSGAQQLVPQAADREDNKVGDSYRSSPQPLQIVAAYKDSPQNSRSVQKGFVKEADQPQRGIRRHLQFGVTTGCKDTGNETNNAANTSLPDCLASIESLVPHHAEPNGISSPWQAGNHPQTVTSLSSFCPSQSVRLAREYGHDIPSCIPSRLAFPLSGTTRSMPMADLTASKKLAGNLHEQEEKQVSDRNHGSAQDLLDIIPMTSVAGEIYAHVDDNQQEIEAVGTVGSATYLILTMQSPCDFLCVTPYDQQVVPYEGRTLTSSNTNMVGELNQVSSKQNRHVKF
ncbi:conserved hypothetical protein [Ricinus communis]|uniref:Uncharacterized protein n=1 Tax=Ricinus communis TaxID=3988 RepID=B9RV09_RICCO|nr:conserved hypothetical protein [Ricinus communis]